MTEKRAKNYSNSKNHNKKQTEPARRLADVSSQIDKAFDQFYFEMDEEEIKVHMMRMVYHMPGI